MRCTLSCRFAMAAVAATVLVSRVDAQSFLGPNEDSDLGDCCTVGTVEDGEVDFEIDNVFFLDNDESGENGGGAWEKFPAIPFGPDTEFPNSIPVGTVVTVHESITLNAISPGFTAWRENLRADSIVYEAYAESIGDPDFEGAVDGVYTANWVEGSAMAMVDGQNVLATAVYDNQDDDSAVSLYFNQMIGGTGQAVTLEIWKQFITSSEIPLYHPEDTNQAFPGGVAYIAMPEFPGPIVPEPSTCVMVLLGGLLAVPGACRRLS